MKTFGLLFLFLLFAALHEGSAAEQFLRKEHPQGKEEIDVKNRLRCSAQLPRLHRLQNRIELRRSQRPNRLYRILTPPNYDPRLPSKVLLYFHGWGEDSTTFGEYQSWVNIAKEENYVVVVPEGIQNSWQFPGSSDGIGSDESSITTCDTRRSEPEYCYQGSCPCHTRCGWTQCRDDDLQFALDLIQDIPNQICVDDSRIYAMGISNGAMLTWSMAQDRRIAPLLAGIAPLIGVPHNDYSRGKASPYNLPAIGIYGTYDDVVPPGNWRDDITTDDGGYYWIPAHRMHQRWAEDHGCPVQSKNRPAPNTYYESDDLNGFSVQCRTYCQGNSVPYSLDCRMDAGHDTPSWMMHMALRFFERHYDRSQLT